MVVVHIIAMVASPVMEVEVVMIIVQIAMLIIVKHVPAETV